MSLSGPERAALGELADLLIPATEGMPSATQAEAHMRWLDAALAARPDTVDAIHRLTGQLGSGIDAERLSELWRTEPDRLGTVAYVLAGAYFMNPDVRDRLNYDGQAAREERQPLAQLQALTQHVRQRPFPSPGAES